MANQIKQFRYYNDPTVTGISRNSPRKKSDTEYITYLDYVSGDIFDIYYPIYQLGLQTLPGTKFYLNDNTEATIVGQTGIYELDLGLNTKITKITFDSASMNRIKDNDNAYLIVDFMYDDSGMSPVEIEEV